MVPVTLNPARVFPIASMIPEYLTYKVSSRITPRIDGIYAGRKLNVCMWWIKCPFVFLTVA